MATSEPLPQGTMRESRRLRGQEPLSPSSPERVVGSAATPPLGGPPPCGGNPSTSTTPDNAHSGSPRSHSRRMDPTALPDLLSLRRNYHRAATMSSHHLEFLDKCETASHVPPGLQIQVYASGTSPVEAEINTIVNTAQHDIIQTLRKHYNTVFNNAQEKTVDITSTLSSCLHRFPSSQVTSHETAMEKTKANIEKKRSKLATRTERKLIHQTG